MTYKFSNKSEQILNTVRLELNILAHKVLEISPIDFTIVEGYRDIERQKQLYKEGKTKTLNSKHCTKEAIDIVPYINNKLDYEAVNDCCFIYARISGRAATVTSMGCMSTNSPAEILFVARSNINFTSPSRQSIVSRDHMIAFNPNAEHAERVASQNAPEGGANSVAFTPSTASISFMLGAISSRFCLYVNLE